MAFMVADKSGGIHNRLTTTPSVQVLQEFLHYVAFKSVSNKLALCINTFELDCKSAHE